MTVAEFLERNKGLPIAFGSEWKCSRQKRSLINTLSGA